MEIAPARIDQLQRHDGRYVEIEADVGNVAADLRDIDERLRLRWSDKGGYFVVFFRLTLPSGEERDEMVLTAQECDQRIVKRVQEIGSPDYNYAADIDRLDKKRNEQLDYEFSEKVGPIAERLHFELRKAGGATDRAFVPRGIE